MEMKEIGHFPMSENHSVFRGYLKQALSIIEERTGGLASTNGSQDGRSGVTSGAGTT